MWQNILTAGKCTPPGKRFLRLCVFMKGRSRIAAFEKLEKEIARGTRVVSLNGLTSTAAKAFVLSKLRLERNKTLVVVTDSNLDLEAFRSDLLFNSKLESRNPKIVTLPSFETDVYSGVSP